MERKKRGAERLFMLAFYGIGVYETDSTGAGA